MRTAVIEVSGLISSLSAQGVEKQLNKLTGIEKASVNYVSGSAAVTLTNSTLHSRHSQPRVNPARRSPVTM